MKTLKTIAALSLVAGGMMVAGLSNSADAGCYGGYCAPSYGYNYHAPLVVSYPRYDIHCDSYGCHYFNDTYGIRHDVYATSFSNRYFYNYGGTQHFILGY